MKINNLKTIAAVVALLAYSTLISAQTLKLPAPSPLQKVEQAFALSNITIEYSRPSAKGRVIFGDLVPFGKVWRTGANNSTQITFGEAVKIQSTAVAAGTYALYTIPNKDSWEIMLYKDLTLGGNVADYKTENEVLHIKAKPTAMATKTETFTINVANIAPSTANIELTWEQTQVAFEVVADIDAKIMKNIETSLASDSRPYFQAATYYNETGKDLNKALEWVNKAMDQNPKAFWVAAQKAKIELKLKNNKAAIATAENVIALAKEAKNDDYVKIAEKIIAEAKK